MKIRMGWSINTFSMGDNKVLYDSNKGEISDRISCFFRRNSEQIRKGTVNLDSVYSAWMKLNRVEIVFIEASQVYPVVVWHLTLVRTKAKYLQLQ